MRIPLPFFLAAALLLSTPALAQPYAGIARWSETYPPGTDLILATPDQADAMGGWQAVAEAAWVHGARMACDLRGTQAAAGTDCAAAGGAAVLLDAADALSLVLPDSVMVIASGVAADSAGVDRWWSTNEAPPIDLDAWYRSRAAEMDRPAGSDVILAAPAQVDVPYLLAPGTIELPTAGVSSDLERAALAFRAERIAIAWGIHERLSAEPYAFYRGYQVDRGRLDEAIVVMGAEGKLRLNVSRVLPDNAILRDRLSGAIGIVSFGEVAFQVGDSGLLLLDVLQ